MGSASATRIDRLQRRAAKDPRLVALGGGLPDPRYFPKRDLGDALQAALRTPASSLQYGWPEGEPELRTWIAARLRARGADVGPEHVIVTNGAQQAISLSLRTLFEPGDLVGFDDETYPGALEGARSLGLRIGDVRERAAGHYLMPAVSNPRGDALGPDERRHLLRRAERHGELLVEDDAYAEFAFDGRAARPLLADLPEQVIHVGTVSKVLCPGLRVGWLVSRHPRLAELLSQKQSADLQAGSLAQRVLVEYVRGERFERHLARIRRGYARKSRLLREAVLRALPEFRVDEPIGGFSLWLEHREPRVSFDGPTLLEAAVRLGVNFDPGCSFRSRPQRRLALRLCHSGVDEDDIESGVELLARALREVSARPERRAG